MKPEDAYHHIQLRYGSVELPPNSPVHRHMVVLSTFTFSVKCSVACLVYSNQIMCFAYWFVQDF